MTHTPVYPGVARVERALAACDDAMDFDALLTAVVEAVEEARSVAEVAAVLAVPPLDEATVGDAGHPQPLVDAVWRQAWRAKQPEGVALASRLAVVDPWWPAAPEAPKRAAQLALDLAAPALRAAVLDRPGRWRAACALALGRRAGADPEDVRVLSQALAAEPDPAVAAALAWALACLGQAPTYPNSAGTFGNWTAAVAHARTRGSVAAAEAELWAKALADRRPFPAASGWSCPGEPRPSPRQLALAALRRLEVTDPAPLLGALCRGSADPGAVAEIAWRLAFAEGAEVPACGVTLDALRRGQRTALAALSRDRTGAHRYAHLGLGGSGDVRALLDATAPAWRPLRVQTPAGPRRWHLWAIWRAVLWGELQIGPAVAALVGPLSAAEIRATYADPLRSARLQRHGHRRGPEHAERDQALKTAIEAAP